MSYIALTIPSNGAAVNPTELYVPRRTGTTSFADSRIFDGDVTTIKESNIGIALDYANQITKFGRLDTSGNQTLITVNDESGRISLDGLNILPNTAGLLSGKYLRLYINGTEFKIALLLT